GQRGPGRRPRHINALLKLSSSRHANTKVRRYQPAPYKQAHQGTGSGRASDPTFVQVQRRRLPARL
ncbi:unnamed protein product, partial [Musa hybrid cultivar]